LTKCLHLLITPAAQTFFKTESRTFSDAAFYFAHRGENLFYDYRYSFGFPETMTFAFF